MAATGEPFRVPVSFAADANPEEAQLVVDPDLGDDPDEVLLTARLAANGVDAGGDFDLEDPDVSAALAKDEDWRVLLQLEPVEDVDWEDFDRLYVVVEAARAAAGDFSRAWVVQGYRDE